ncbi:DUF7282 domain-containing protein [Methanoculleus sp. UBA303]|jgi:hypothetical protein|uniref:DUF7282 domain-containing protein n=1 Tax=Methanoculleus sp. UBA303 TaxID=1915497 RepID=UPI002600E87A|nr:hypothetical protein [Methanoculleus sp. UBA303]
MKKYWLVITAVLAACCIGLVSAQAEGGTNETANASITVTDQMVAGDGVVGNVTVDEAVSNGTGWLVIHNNLFGHPGGVIGYAPVESGVNTDVTVTIHTFVATDTLFAVLHHDAGKEGVFEYPIPDVEQRVGGEIVIVPFNATAENATLLNLTALCPASGTR